MILILYLCIWLASVSSNLWQQSNDIIQMISLDYQQQGSSHEFDDKELTAFISESKYLFKEKPDSFYSNKTQQIDERLEQQNREYLEKRFPTVEPDTLEGIVAQLTFQLRDFSEKDLEILKEYKKKIEKIEGMKSNVEEKIKDKNQESTMKKDAKKSAAIFNTQPTPKKVMPVTKPMFPKLENLPLLCSAATQKNNKDDSCKKK